MIKRISIIILPVLFSLFLSPNNTQAETVYTTKTLYSVSDTYMSTSYPSSNNGNNASISVGWFQDEIRRGFVKFNMVEIPASATITGASFNLYMIQSDTGCWGTPFPNQLIIGQNTSDWAENTTGWSNKPSYSTWQSYLSPACPAHWYYMSVTDIVRNWVSGQPNYGFQISGGDTGSLWYRNFSTREATLAWTHPQLVISYSYSTIDDPYSASNPPASQPVASSSNTSSTPGTSSTTSSTTNNSGSDSSPATTENGDASGLPKTDTGFQEVSKEKLAVGAKNLNRLLNWLNSLSMLQRRLLVGGMLILLVALFITGLVIYRKKQNNKNNSKETQAPKKQSEN